ncbi:VOC family protein [Falsiroseomonas oryziterrae]|uniref:VOC family protein n=1 Tax=Falsiroseomonas oryziterrae TaxID=2911368 RepID=UPI001F3B2685|nr:VOC family protein [Roseomonas sp. NPKOSM-4]
MGPELHHVSLPVENLARSREFYAGVLGLIEVPRPGPFEAGPKSFPGAWYQLGSGQLHLIVSDPGRASPPTYRTNKKLDARDVHVALRVRSFAKALEVLTTKGYRVGHPDDFKDMRVSPNLPHQGAGFPQIYILDPDRHTVEINAETLDIAPERLAALDIGIPREEIARFSHEATRIAPP